MKSDAGQPSTTERLPTPSGTAKRGRGAGELASDQGGAIMLVGAFMAFFLTAGLFFIMGTGEAIIYRERVQDAADAIAFSSAGVHARGMNLIVLINMIMAAILAVLVALKMLQVMTLILTTIACIIAAIPVFGSWAIPFCSAGVQFAPKLQNAVSRYQQVVDRVLPALSFLQRVVAWTTPYVALAKSPGVAQKYEPLVTGGLMISPSMVPCVPGGCDDGKLGLPVSEDSYAHLCEKAGTYVVEIAFFWMVGPLAILKEGLERFAGWLAGTFPGYFCGGGGMDGGASGIDGAAASLEDLAKKTCEAIEDGKKDEYKDAHDGSLDGFDFDMDQCKEDKQEEFSGQVDEQLGEGTADTMQGTMQTDNKTPKKVYDGAEHGGFYFQTFGFANAEADRPRRNDRGVEIASKTGGVSRPGEDGDVDVTSNLFTAMRFAQAEFYFDRPGTWEDNSDDAMWTMAWRARLRRIRPMAPDIGNFSFQYATGKLTDLIGTQVTQALMDGDIFDFILGQGAFDFAQNWLNDQAGALGSQLDDVIDSKLQFTSWEVIH